MATPPNGSIAITGEFLNALGNLQNRMQELNRRLEKDPFSPGGGAHDAKMLAASLALLAWGLEQVTLRVMTDEERAQAVIDHTRRRQHG